MAMNKKKKEIYKQCKYSKKKEQTLFLLFNISFLILTIHNDVMSLFIIVQLIFYGYWAEAENSSYTHFSQSQTQWVHINILKTHKHKISVCFVVFFFALSVSLLLSAQREQLMSFLFWHSVSIPHKIKKRTQSKAFNNRYNSMQTLNIIKCQLISLCFHRLPRFLFTYRTKREYHQQFLFVFISPFIC